MRQHADFERLERSALRRSRRLRVVTYVGLTIWALVVLFPFYWMVLTSLKSYGSYNSEHTPVFFTPSPTLENYWEAFTAVPLGGYLLNTLIFSVINAFKCFREIFLIGGEHPVDELYMLQHFINNCFSNLNYQKLSVASVLLLIVIIVFFGLFYAFVSRKEAFRE